MNLLPFYLQKKAHKLKYLFFKYISKPIKPLKSIYGVYLTPAFNDTTFMYCYKGTYGLFLADFIKNISCDTIFMDIGANQGLYSILAGKNKNIKKVIAFEPSNKTAQLLRSNITFNKIKNCIIVEKGVSSKSGFLSLNISKDHSGKNSFRKALKTQSNHSEMVETMNHQEIELLTTEDTNYVIKIDVEGHEEIVIDEITKCTFIKNVSAIFCEIDTNWVDVNNIKKKLKTVGFQTFKKIGKGKMHYDLLILKN